MSQTASRQFDAQGFVRGLSLGDQLFLGGAIVFVIFGFFSWIGVDVGIASVSQNGLHGWGILAWLVAIVGAAFVVIRTEVLRSTVKLPALPTADWLIATIAGAVTLLCTFLYWLEYKQSADNGLGVSIGTSQKFGWYVALIAAAVMTAGGYLKQRDPAIASTPSSGGGYGTPPQGGYGAPPPAQGGYGTPPTPPQQGGYGAPPPPAPPGSGYGAPPPPPPAQ